MALDVYWSCKTLNIDLSLKCNSNKREGIVMILSHMVMAKLNNTLETENAPSLSIEYSN